MAGSALPGPPAPPSTQCAASAGLSLTRSHSDGCPVVDEALVVAEGVRERLDLGTCENDLGLELVGACFPLPKLSELDRDLRVAGFDQGLQPGDLALVVGDQILPALGEGLLGQRIEAALLVGQLDLLALLLCHPDSHHRSRRAR